jgi:tRNA pseudouridine13 synthase
MYVHAYQSYVWNVVASTRIKLTATKVLEGDLVLVDFNGAMEDGDMYDPDEGGQFSLEAEDGKEQKIAVKVLTTEDVASGTYTIHDIVLPTPGYDVTYPAREALRKAYVDTMAPNDLDPFNMRRVVRETSMVGHYRRLIHRPQDVQWEILRYDQRDTLFESDGDWKEGGEFMALRVQLRLGTSQYATMALREVCKRDSAVIQFWGKERDDLEKAKKVEKTEVAT